MGSGDNTSEPTNFMLGNEFQTELIDHKNRNNLTNSQIADELMVSRPTIQRWVTGKNLPHPLVQKSIVKHFNENTPKGFKEQYEGIFWLVLDMILVSFIVGVLVGKYCTSCVQ